MTNVLHFPNPAEATAKPSEKTLDARHYLAGAKSLWQYGVIHTDSFFVAAQVCSLLLQTDKPYVTLSLVEAQKRIVTVNGEYFSGPLKQLTSCQDFSLALLDLHYQCGILSNLDRKFLNQSGRPRQHFTIPHPMRRGYLWDENTTIYFTLQKFAFDEYSTMVKDQMDSRVQDCEALTLVRG